MTPHDHCNHDHGHSDRHQHKHCHSWDSKEASDTYHESFSHSDNECCAHEDEYSSDHSSCEHNGSYDVTERLLYSNSRWATNVLHFQPDFFRKSAKGQTPNVLWIGCSDSRVPESLITCSRPGDIFVHRNIANQVHEHDLNLLSVLEYAVDHLHVEHVIVVGHSQCGGVSACLAAAKGRSSGANSEKHSEKHSPPDAALGKWLKPLTNLLASLGRSGSIKITGNDDKKALSIAVNANVKQQVRNLAKTAVIKRAWKSGKPLEIHGWVYKLETGFLHDLDINQSEP